MTLSFKSTKIVCFLSYCVQGITNNLSPLLFVIYCDYFGFSFVQLSLLITINFTVQIFVDFISSFISKIFTYRQCIVTAHVLAFSGLISLSSLPFIIPDGFTAICISTVLMSIGSGIIEVFVSPIIEALPGDNKTATMNILHSFYCWGHVGVILVSTIYFFIFGTVNWFYLPIVWSLVPLFCAIMFVRVPIQVLDGDVNGENRFKAIARNKYFWLMMIIMLCAGASELGLAQWSSLFCEEGLGISKTLGDLIGPCSFAVFMGIGRVFFGRLKSHNTINWLLISFGACFVSYIITAFAPHPLISLIGFALCGISVSFLWPGTYSMGAEKLPNGGSLMFALFALMGDIGCSLGPDIIGIVSEKIRENASVFEKIFSGSSIEVGMKSGILIASIIPLIGFIVSLVYFIISKYTLNKNR